ncbi:MAG: polymer-forming cytoskeletal protein [Spirochaetales bacterium]
MAISYHQKEGNVTVLGKETEFNGVMEFTDNLIITGKFTGSIKSTGSLVIEKTGECVADNAGAESITVAGKVEGSLSATDKLEMLSGSSVIGNVETARLRIDDDVNFHGAVKMTDTLPDMDIFSVSPQEYRELISRRAIKEDTE